MTTEPRCETGRPDLIDAERACDLAYKAWQHAYLSGRGNRALLFSVYEGARNRLFDLRRAVVSGGQLQEPGPAAGAPS